MLDLFTDDTVHVSWMAWVFVLDMRYLRSWVVYLKIVHTL